MRFFLFIFVVHVATAPGEAQTFIKHPITFSVGPNVSDIVAVDMNDDDLPEIIASIPGRLSDPREEAPAQYGLSFLVAQGGLRYESLPPLSAGFAPYCIAVANIDALKAPDLVVANFLATQNRDISLFRNLGEEKYEPHHFAIDDRGLRYTKVRDGDGFPVFTTPGITAIAVLDFDHDGYRDIIATGWSSDVLIYLPGAYDDYFGDPVLFPASGGPRDVKIGDFNDDGKDDLAVVMYNTNEISIWEGTGTGSFKEVTRFDSRGKLPQKLEVQDMNGDGFEDLVVSHSHADDSIVLFYGQGDFHFALSLEIFLGKNRHVVEYEITDLVVADFNADNRLDFAVACYLAGEVIAFLNKPGALTPGQEYTKEVYSYKKGKPHALCVADFNADGKKDLAVALWETDTVSLLLSR